MMGVILMAFAMLLVLGGGAIGAGHTAVGLVCIAFGAVGLGAGTAACRLHGFSHFVDTGAGMETADLFGWLVSKPEHRDVFVQTEGNPVRAAGLYTARYNGRDALIIEAVREN